MSVSREGIFWLGSALHDVLHPQAVPGYSSLSWAERCQVNARALRLFLTSLEFVRLVLWLLAWQLGAHYLLWSYDLRGGAAAIPVGLALIWLLPWVARARRRQLARLLGPHWGI